MYSFEYFVVPAISVVVTAIIMSKSLGLSGRCGLIFAVVSALSVFDALLNRSNSMEFNAGFLLSNIVLESIAINMVAVIVTATTHHFVENVKLFISILSGFVALLAMPIYGLFIACYIGGC